MLNSMSTNANGQPNRLSPAYVDTDLMPFGKYKDKCLRDVPESYLCWLWHNGVREKRGTDMLANYIWNSRNAINQEIRGDVEPIG